MAVHLVEPMLKINSVSVPRIACAGRVRVSPSRKSLIPEQNPARTAAAKHRK
jgi:hypothetical protein